MKDSTVQPFSASFDEIQSDMQAFVEAVFEALGSDFLIMPRGAGFVDYSAFERAYEVLKRFTKGFEACEPPSVHKAIQETPLVVIVLRTILGLTPPEWADVSIDPEIQITQGWIRGLDRSIRMDPDRPLPTRGATPKRLQVLVETACELLEKGAPQVPSDEIHRLDKVDSEEGLTSLRRMAELGVPYPVLLYERYLGRPFASHRDSVSELIGGALESEIEDRLVEAGISYRETGRAERVRGFDQAPDFIVPSEFNPAVVIEAKVTQDDGTARDKVTRLQHLDRLRNDREAGGEKGFEVIACISGRGFGVRRSDMEKLLRATRGKVFTLSNLDQLVETTRLREFRTRGGSRVIRTRRRS